MNWSNARKSPDRKYEFDSGMEEPIRYRPDIDGLRAVAVLLVVLFHAGHGLPGGYIGVDVFFVISGFLITQLILADISADRFTLSGFLIRRAKRILPILLVVVLTTLCFGLYYLWPDDLALLARSAISVLLFASNIFFWTDLGYFSADAESQLLLHTWSLAVEEQFYLLYPVLLVVLLKRFGITISIIVLLVLAVASFLISLIALKFAPSSAFYLLPPRGWEFLVGGLLASSSSLPRFSPSVNNVIAVVGLSAIIVYALQVGSSSMFPGVLALVPAIGTAAIIFSSLNSPTVVAKILSVKYLVFIGLISYSLYLWHWPVLQFARIMFPDVLYVDWLALAASGLLSVLSWRVVEQPFRQSSVNTRTLAGFILSLSFMIFAVCFTILVNSGLPNRNPQFSTLERDSQFEVSDLELELLQGKLLGKSDVESTQILDFLVIGDSHAAMMLPMLDQVARELGATGLSAARAGRKPFGDFQDNRSLNRLLVEMIETHRPKAVILIARWSSLFGANIPSITYQRNLAIVSSLLQATERVGGQTLLVSQVPDYTQPRGVLRQQMLSASKQHTFPFKYPAIDLKELGERTKTTAEAFVELSREGADFVDLKSSFFDSDGRHNVQSTGRLLYWDAHHLTQAGAIELLSESFKPVLQKIKLKR